MCREAHTVHKTGQVPPSLRDAPGRHREATALCREMYRRHKPFQPGVSANQKGRQGMAYLECVGAGVGPHPGRSALQSAPTTSSFAPSATWATPSHKCGLWAPGLGSQVTTPQPEHRQERSAGGCGLSSQTCRDQSGRWPFRVWRI